MQVNKAGLTESAPAGWRPPSIAGGAALIAGLTLLAKLMGLVRTLVFSQTIGADCLGTAYTTAYQVPNLITEVILAGALTSAMIPVLARSAERAAVDPDEKARIRQISSAALTWVVIILVPFALVVAAAAEPIASLLNPTNPSSHCARADMVSTTGTILQVFSPQVVLYGLAVVLFGLLQAFRRFTAPALAPVIASLIMIASYVAFVPLGKGLPFARMPLSAELVLSVGTTLGVASLVLVALVPTWRLHLKLRPALRFPPGVARFVGGMAIVGVVEFVASDVNTVVVIALANGRGDTGALVIFNYAFLIFNAVFAVLALSIITSAFPVLSARDGAAFDRTCAGSMRAVLLMSWLGTAVIAAICVPAAHVLAKHPGQIPELIQALALFAPAVASFAVVTNTSRVMFALRRLKVAAVALGGGWLLVTVADVVLAELVPAHLVVAALALGTTIGQTLVAVPLVIVTRRIRGRAAVEGVGRAALVGLAAGVAGAAVGVAVTMTVPISGKLVAAGLAVPAAACAVIVFGVVAYALDKRDLAAVMLRLRQFARSRS